MGKLYDKNLKVVLNKSQTKQLILTDGGGLGARVSVLGKIRWQFRYKINGASKRLDIGNYPEISLVKARDYAQQFREWLADGFDPKIQRELERSKTLTPVTIKDALEYWLVEYAEQNRANAPKHRSQFERHIYPYIGHLSVEQAETRHWIECFDRVRKGIPNQRRPAPVAAGYIFGNAKQALRFCRVRRYAISRVLDDLTITDVGNKQGKRDRVLTSQEVKDVWALSNKPKTSAYNQMLLQLLMIFGCRTQEARLSTWNEWDFNKCLWTVPKAHSKNGDLIVRPIPGMLVEPLKAIKADADGDALILGQLKTVESVSCYGRILWKKLGHSEKWTLHDFRRTVATKMSDLGVAPHVVEQLLGHTLGGVAGIYNRSQYSEEKEKAMNTWVEHLNILCNPADNVVSIVSGVFQGSCHYLLNYQAASFSGFR